MIREKLLRGEVVQVNMSLGGVPKRPIEHGVIRRLGLVGDAVAHPKFHGGPRQALLLISTEIIDSLVRQGYPLFPGALGENITMRGLAVSEMRLGQRYQLGTAQVTLTKVRVPCRTLDRYGPTIQKQIYDKAVKAGDILSARWGWSGFYVSVEQEGEVRPGDPIIRVTS